MLRTQPITTMTITSQVSVRLASRATRSGIDPLRELVLVYFGLGIFADNAAAAHVQDAVADRAHLRNLVRDEEDADPPAGKPPDDLINSFLVADVDAHRRRIEDKDLGVC